MILISGLLKPRVSIIMPAYNRADYIEQAIQSVLAQTYPKWELIIVDDGSTDSTEELVRKYLQDERIRYHKNEKNLGIAKSRNIALRMARGKYIAHLDSDDFLHPEALRYCISVLGSGIALVYTDLFWFRYRGEWHEIHKEDEQTYREFKEFFPSHLCVYSRKVAIREHMFNEKLIYTCEDLNMWIKILKNYPIKHVKKPLYYWRIHGENTSLNIHPLRCVDCPAYQDCLVPAVFPSYRNLQAYRKTKENIDFWKS